MSYLICENHRIATSQVFHETHQNETSQGDSLKTIKMVRVNAHV